MAVRRKDVPKQPRRLAETALTRFPVPRQASNLGRVKSDLWPAGTRNAKTQRREQPMDGPSPITEDGMITLAVEPFLTRKHGQDIKEIRGRFNPGKENENLGGRRGSSKP